MNKSFFILFFLGLCLQVQCAVKTADNASSTSTFENEHEEVPNDIIANEIDAGTPESMMSSNENQDAGVVEEGNQITTIDSGQASQTSDFELCFADIDTPEFNGPDYDQFTPVIGSHCAGTQHQDFENIERVVFIGDSVTMGSPPTLSQDFYRNKLTQWLVTHYGLQAPNSLWERYNVLDGHALIKNSGDFWNCSRWGARTDDLMQDNGQILDCFPQSERHKKTLVVLTIGGNDISNLTQNGYNRSYEQNKVQVENFVRLLRETIEWLKNSDNIPGGVQIVFGNMFEFTDGTGDISSCPASSFAGFEDWEDVTQLQDLVIWANEQFLKIAVDTGSDMVFMLEHFCGHGFTHEDPNGRCYRGPNTEQWFDLTCIHPNPAGHGALADLFRDVIAGE
tara:strand:+ start:123 stop:1304 length:1182 start_codon:yes stop_codon:yes gene_type:complete